MESLVPGYDYGYGYGYAIVGFLFPYCFPSKPVQH
jgi:hypothetical protein